MNSQLITDLIKVKFIENKDSEIYVYKEELNANSYNIGHNIFI